jgi:hypothetical protein
MRSREELLAVAAEIRAELGQLARVGAEIAEIWRRRPADPAEGSVYLAAGALLLHNFYTGCERIFQRVGTDLNGALPRTPDWHFRLLRSMAIAVPGVRPALIGEDVARDLAEYLRFRHLVRNLYGYELQAGKVEPLVAGLPGLADRFGRAIETFLAYLEDLARRLGEE